MGRNIHLGLILGIGLYSGLSAETGNLGQAGSDVVCGQDIRMHDVLVLDLEPMRNDPEMAQDFVDQRAGDFRLVNSDIEEIRTRSRPSKDPHGVIRSARKLGVKHGCDLVLVLKTGPYFGKQRGWRMKRIKDKGYAFVVVGQRLAFE
ncbi:hypothetical protein ACFL3I_01820 [Pseudomonadota bacterium]